MTDAIQHKICRVCKQSKPMTDFHRSIKRSDGFREKCKVCVAEYHQGRRVRLATRTNVESPIQKLCPTCKQIRPQAEFRADMTRPDGLSAYCAACAQKRDRQRPKKQRRASRRVAYHAAKAKRPHKLAETKLCKYCETIKPANSFAYSPQMADGMKSKCKGCYAEENRKRAREYRERKRAEDPIKFRLMKRGEHCRRYGMSRQDFERMNEAQKGKCAICGGGPNMNRRFLDVDHDHGPDGKVRELLCTKCNTGIGRFNDDPDLCIKAAEYLRKHRQLKLVV